MRIPESPLPWSCLWSCSAVLLSCAPTPGQGSTEQEILARLQLIIVGDHTIDQQGAEPVARADVDLCFRAMTHESVAVASHACLCFEKLAGYPFFPKIPQKRFDAIVTALTERIGHPHDDTSYWSCRALIAIGLRGRALDRKKADATMRPQQIRQIISQALALAMRPDPRLQHRAGLLLLDFEAAAEDQVKVEIGRTLLAAIQRHAKTGSKGDAQRKNIGIYGLKAALSRLHVTDRAVATEMAQLFLCDVQVSPVDDWALYGKADGLRALARLLGGLEAGLREAVFACLLAAVADSTLVYMPTSGRRSPFRHHGAEALMAACPVLDAEEVERAASVLSRARQAAGTKWAHGIQPQDFLSMFGAAEAAVVRRRSQLAKRRR